MNGVKNVILDFLGDGLDGDSWESLCQSCYRIRYQSDHYTEIPATYEGDAGIEGFTQTGVVIQCYCPEKNFSDNDLHSHLRDKMTKDIGKLLDKAYQKRLKELGVPTIHEWHFVVPEYKDARIIKHAETKKQEVLQRKKDNPSQYDYIGDDFSIIIKQAEDFNLEIARIYRKSITDHKLNLNIRKIKDIDWDECPSEKADNIRRKVKAIMNCDNDNDKSLNQMVNIYIKSYIEGILIFRELEISYTEIYEEVYSLEQAYKKQVEIKTCMNPDKSLHNSIFNEILNDFEKKLKETCPYFDASSIINLKIDIISGWLADCSMMFRK